MSGLQSVMAAQGIVLLALSVADAGAEMAVRKS